ncbi:DUF4912 domain-containing protein [Planctomycetes bacterium K23_9]|uniref:DUF4912 domain-containing protein n=1 Tax=Stieleria marina TaxID=1930275 RepID=UPI00119DDF45
MIKTADLKAQTRRELADLAKNYGVPKWHAMKKDELVDAVTKAQRRLRRQAGSSKTSTAKSSPTAKKSSRKTPASKASRPAATASSSSKTNGTLRASKSSSAKNKASSSKTTSLNDRPIPEPRPPRVSPKTARIRAQMKKRREAIQKNKDISTGTLVGGAAVKTGSDRSRGSEPHKDRVILLVRDSFWLQASWEITQASVQRAQASMAEKWHTAKPCVRVLAVGSVAENRAETVERDIMIHGGVDTWYIDVQDPPSRYRVLVGYLADNDQFYTICRSNTVETPQPGECERLDEHWRDIAEDYERVFSLSGGYDSDSGDLRDVFEERLRRAMPCRGDKGQTVAEPSLLRQTHLPFNVDAELIVFGKTAPNSSVTVAQKPVKLQPDGSFTVRMQLPDKRQVLPITAESRDGLRQRTTVIAVERNTKVMEAVELDDRL